MKPAMHPYAPEQVMAFVDGALPQPEAASVASHLYNCNDCSVLAFGFRTVSGRFGTWQVEPVGDAISERLVSEAHDLLAKRATANRFWLLFGSSRKMRLALAGIALAALIVLVLQPLRMPHAHREAAFNRDRAFLKPPASSGASAAQNWSMTREQALDKARAAAALTSENMDSQTASGGSMGGTIGGVVGGVGRGVGAGNGPAALASPMIARTADLAITVKKFDPARATLQTILIQYHGYIAEMTVSGGTAAEPRSLTATLKVPAQELDAALAALKTAGDVTRESLSGEEVTEEHADLVARLKNSRETESRLQDILRTRTGKVSDVLEVEQEIARVRQQIEEMEAQQRVLEGRVSFATIRLTLCEEYKAQVGALSVPTRLRNAAIRGYRDGVESLIGFVAFVLETGPTLLFYALFLIPLIWGIWRRWRLILRRVSTSLSAT